ncbi:MAG: dienelactone hydrolase family protein [Pseudolabrys sp.]
MMTRLAAFAALALVCTAAAAQEPKHPPLVIDNDTVGTLRKHQTGSIILPAGTPPFPAVVVLHGCNGITPNVRIWARRLASWGYAALIVDSFTPRGIKDVCGHGLAFPGRERAKDAFAAAAYLRTRADIDPARIGAIGFSHGGWTAIAAALERFVTENAAKPFDAIVAYYPNCPPYKAPMASDLLILAAGADDWASPKRCTDLAARYADAPAHKPLLKIYPGAFHTFDANRPDRIYFGHRLAYDANAATDPFDMTKKFLDSHLQGEKAQ